MPKKQSKRRAPSPAPEIFQPTICAAELCAKTGLTDRQHRNIAKAGFFPPPLRGNYQHLAALNGLIRYFREQLSKRSGKKEKELERLAEVKRKTAEFELAELQRLYVLRAEIGPALRNLSLHQRAKLQFKLESELAPQLAGLHPLEIRSKLAAAVDEICTLFQEGTRQWMDQPPTT